MRAAATLTVLVLAACSAPAPSESNAPANGGCDLKTFLAVQQAHANHAEVTLCGKVTRVRPIILSASGSHRIFSVGVAEGDEIEISSNVDIMDNFPIKEGDYTVVRGEYYYDGPGREGVHYTHRASGRHPSGFVTIEGKTYR
ncbi:MAG: hypothetical protein NVSMB5_10460 [Candidatus Velthaea sp.]